MRIRVVSRRASAGAPPKMISPRSITYKRLAKLAGSIDGIEESKILELLLVSDKPDKDGGLNIGNETTNDIKQMVKANRVTGVHVTPTVLFNGGQFT